MKKIISMFIVGLLLFSFTACNNSNENNDINLVSIQTVRDTSDKVMSKLKNGDYENLVYDNSYLSIPNVNEIYCLERQGENYFKSANEFMEYSFEYFNLFNDSIDKSKVKIWKNGELVSVVDELKTIDDNTSIDNYEGMIIYDQPQFFMQMTPNLCLNWANNGVTAKLINDPSSNFPLLSPKLQCVDSFLLNRIYNEDINYKLLSGNVSLKEAVNYTKDYLQNKLPYYHSDELSEEIYYARVYKVNEDTYAYELLFRHAYEGIPFDETFMGGYEKSSNTNRTGDSSSTLTIEKDKLDCMINCGGFYQVTKKGEPIKKIVSLEDALNIVSQRITSETQFKVESIELLYGMYRDMNNIMAPTEYKPEWRIITINPNDTRMTDFYVDAVTSQIDLVIHNNY